MKMIRKTVALGFAGLMIAAAVVAALPGAMADTQDWYLSHTELPATESVLTKGTPTSGTQGVVAGRIYVADEDAQVECEMSGTWTTSISLTLKFGTISISERKL
ncbi:MAG: hypothetical protein CVT48_00575 [Thermoplasmata archaeon HGW-Thermoplasmata-1]|nr:MAG: hypothetical protein CVT48_00575 [Thermoplasmata archaeon HGW-Thermoplasmata-1]